MAVQTPSHARCTKESCLLEELQKTISGGCLFVAPVAGISLEKNLSVGVSTGGRINGNPEKKIMNGSSVDDVQ
ncbi:hypothetical protein EsCd1HHP049_05348 (plasmid) [Escherichia sp. HH154_1D]|nr:hypothetical protein EsCdI10290_05496 [Escherichia sp. 10290]BDI49096.1 hypothetical protein EsCd1HHP049_05348 [Escherichia sp. HH154_1D]BDI53918.1 hypothetical protein EsCd1KSP079_05371 [Escherichia sp. KS167_9B]